MAIKQNVQEIRKERVKGYFLDAAKEIIIKDGVDSASVRTVAEKAGYSYATLYNYFNDLDDLLEQVKEEMIKDLMGSVAKASSEFSHDIDGLMKLIEVYTDYYFEQPNIFKFFYFHSLPKTQDSLDKQNFDRYFNIQRREIFNAYLSAGPFTREQIETMDKLCIYMIHGILTFHFSHEGAWSKQRLMQEIKRSVGFLLESKGEPS
jgi:AcrR family transcriptional regulator